MPFGGSVCNMKWDDHVNPSNVSKILKMNAKCGLFRKYICNDVNLKVEILYQV